LTTANLTAGTGFLSYCIQNTIGGVPIHLGVILSGSELPEATLFSDPSQFVNAEYNASPWIRPVQTIISPGTYNPTLSRFEIPPATEWTFTAPSGGFSIKQIFVIINGSTTPRDTNGTFIGVATFASAIAVPGGTSQSIKLPWSLKSIV
jgi:hypothetical protein